jgi:hypothetical protein
MLIYDYCDGEKMIESKSLPCNSCGSISSSFCSVPVSFLFNDIFGGFIFEYHCIASSHCQT